MLLFLFFIFLNIKKHGSSDLSALFWVSGVFILSMGFLGERPQLFTFLFFSVILYLLEDFRASGSKKVFLIPVFILILSNMHPGYVVCIFLISLYLAGEGIRYFIKKNSDDRVVKDLFLVWALSIIFALFNPTGLNVFVELFSMGAHTKGIVEFMPPFYIYANKFKSIDYSYIAFLMFSLLSLRYLKKIGFVHIIALAVFTIMSFTAIRYLIFYMAVTAPILALIIMKLKEEKLLRRFSGILKQREGFLYLIAFIIGIFLVFKAIPKLVVYEFRADTSFAAPKDAADFLSNLKIKGNMFNEYSSGGYLIWRLYPDKRVFIDGRSLEPDVYEEYNIIASASSKQNQSWEDILKKYNISYIITPPLLPRGEIYPIVEKILELESWVLIYRDQLTLIFLKNEPENMAIIKTFGKDKKEAYNTIIIQASARAMMNQTNPYYLITLGKVFLRTGRYGDAEKAFEMAFQRDPKNPVITEWLKKVREKKADKL